MGEYVSELGGEDCEGGRCGVERWVVEVGCKRLFGLAGHILTTKCTRLAVRTYEGLAILVSMLSCQVIFRGYTSTPSGWLRSI